MLAAVERVLTSPQLPLREPGRHDRDDGRERERRRLRGREQRVGARRAGRPADSENAGREERGAGDRDEVPVVVDERMDEPQRERDGERGAPRPARSRPAAGARRRRGRLRRRRARANSAEPDEPGPGEELERNAVRLGHRGGDLAVALARDLERVRAGALRAGRASKMSRASPHHASRLFELRLANRPGSFATSSPRNSSAIRPALATRPTTVTATRRRTRARAERAADAPPRGRRPSGRRASSRAPTATSAAPTTRSSPNQAPSATRSAREAPSSTSAGRVNAHAATTAAGHDRDEREQRRLDPVAAKPEPEHDPEHRRRDAGPRRREQHRDDRRVGEHRAAHRARATARAEPRTESASTSSTSAASASAFQYPIGSRSRAARPPSGKSGRDRLAGERPDHGGAEGRRSAPRRRAAPASAPAGAEQEADGEEGGVDERPVQLGPREVGRDRPGDREPAPGRRREQRARAARLRRRAAARGRRARALPSRPRRAARRPPSRPSRPRTRRRAATRSRPTPPLRASASRAKLAWCAGRPRARIHVA